jgi:signal transduction histidine kinase
MRNTSSIAKRWQDWALFGLNTLFLLGISAAVLLVRYQAGPNMLYDDLLIASGIGTAVVVILGCCVFVTALNAAVPYMAMITGSVLTGVYINLTGGEPAFFIGITGAMLLAGVLYLGSPWGILHALLVAAVALGSVIYVLSAQSLDPLLNEYTPSLLALMLLTLVIFGWVYFRSRFDHAQKVELSRTVKAAAEQLEEMRQRSRAIAEMTTALSSTLNFDRIMDAVLDIGLLSLRKRADQRVASMVLLFRSSDEGLYIVNSRGLNRTDDFKVIYGQQGIVARALEEGEPTIGQEANKDPELRSLAAFRNIRSVLCIPLRAHFDNYGVLLFGSDEADAFDEDQIEMLKSLGMQTTVALQNAVLYGNLIEEKRRIIEIENDARKVLNRELHDVPAQTIAAAKMRIDIVKRLMERKPEDVPKELDEVGNLVAQASEEIRNVLSNLRSKWVEESLAMALEQLAERIQKSYNQRVQVRVARDVDQHLDEAQRSTLYHLIQEATNNARKYAEAELISVQVGRKDDFIVARIADNGKGFDVDAVTSNYNSRASFGMVTMQERAELLDGQISIKSVPERGTTITVMIPVGSQVTGLRDGLGAQMSSTKLAATARSNLEAMGRY